jgi:hypothetical protein
VESLQASVGVLADCDYARKHATQVAPTQNACEAARKALMQARPSCPMKPGLAASKLSQVSWITCRTERTEEKLGFRPRVTFED